MAEKYAVLIKYTYLEYVDNAKLSDTDAWTFMKSIIEYDKTGTEPIYSNPILSGLFAVVKIDLDKNKENYENVSQERSKSGKQGAKKRWEEAKNNKNSNCHDDMAIANDDSNCHDLPKKHGKHGKHGKMPFCQKNIAKMHDLDLDSDIDSGKKEISFSPSFLPDNSNCHDDMAIANDDSNCHDLPKTKGPSPPDDKPLEKKEDAATIWNKARQYWNERKLKPECRDVMMRGTDQAEILHTLQLYSWKDIREAIGNYAWHKYKAGQEYRPPPPYGSLAGFLKTGVEKYFDEDALDPQFKEKK